jgi:D-amino peptidase
MSGGGMKVFISSDMEGTAGVVDWSQCRPGEPEHEHYRELLLGEVNAAIEGAADGGATEFLVNDSHSTMQNLRPERLAHRARYLSGRHKPLYMMQGLDASYDAVLLVSYHGSMATSSTLSHTYNPRAIAEVRLNGTVVGESGINALVARAHGVPIVLVTGDDVTAAEARAVLPGIRAAVVKTSVSRFAAESLHPAAARDLIREEARLAVGGLADARPPSIELPATLEVRMRNPDLAEMATWVHGVERTGDVLVTLTDDDPLRLYRRFVTTVLLTRGIAE